MSRKSIARGVKCAGAATAAMLLTASVGTASAAPPDANSAAAVNLQAAASGATTNPVVVPAVTWRDGSPVAAATTAAARPTRAAAQRAAIAVKQARFASFTLRSAATKDLRGVESSLYKGRFYRASVEAKRECIVRRESSGVYNVVSASGSYFGAYQVSRALARGATWMMLKEHKALMGAKEARTVLAKLRATPMNKWPRYWQDAAFSTVWNWKHTGSGAAHWAGGRWRC